MQVITLVLGFVARRLFIDNLPVALLGVSDFFTSFFYSVSLIDIGFASILIYNLYKPLNENDEERVKWLVSAFKKLYMTIAIIIIVISVLLMPLIYTVFKIDYDDKIIVYLIYVIQLITSVSKYFFIHKTNIITVAQQKWKINFITIVLNILWFSLKAISMVYFKSYILYLIVILLDGLVINLINVYLTNNMYPYLKKLPKVSSKEILNSGLIKQSKNFIYHAFYNFVYYSTDNYIIAYKIGTSPLGYINNYTMIINIFNEFISSIIGALRDSFANFLHTKKDISGLYDLYKMTIVLNYFMCSVSIVGLYTMIDRWIPLWLNSGFVIEKGISTLLIMNLGIDLLFRPLENIYTIKGYVFKEKWPIFISALVNLIVSLALVDSFGLVGVFFGTFLGKIVFWWGKIYYVTSDVFLETRSETILDIAKLFIFLIGQVLIINYFADLLFLIVSSLTTFIIRGVFVVVIVLITDIFFFIRSKHFKQLLELLINTLKSFKKGEANA